MEEEVLGTYVDAGLEHELASPEHHLQGGGGEASTEETYSSSSSSMIGTYVQDSELSFLETKEDGAEEDEDDTTEEDESESEAGDEGQEYLEIEEGAIAASQQLHQQRRIASKASSSSHQVESWNIDFEDIKLHAVLGKGAFGKVYKGTLWKTAVAVKMLHQQHMGPTASEDFKREIDILTKLRHPNCVLFLGACTEKELCLVMEYMALGSLQRLLEKDSKSLARERIISIALDIAQGMNYLHSRKPPIVHRDLKSGNILVNANWTAKVADFGLSILLEKEKKRSSSFCTSLQWRAPEATVNSNNPKEDVFSYGILLWEIVTRKTPYHNMSLQEIARGVQQGLRPSIPSYCPPKLSQLMRRCWDTDPAKRPTFADIIKYLKEEFREFLKKKNLQDKDLVEVVSLQKKAADIRKTFEERSNNQLYLPDRRKHVTMHARVSCAMLDYGNMEWGKRLLMDTIFPLTTQVTDGVIFLRDNTIGKLYLITLYKELEDMLKGEMAIAENAELAEQLGALLCTPLVREHMVVVHAEMMSDEEYVKKTKQRAEEEEANKKKKRKMIKKKKQMKMKKEDEHKKKGTDATKKTGAESEQQKTNDKKEQTASSKKKTTKKKKKKRQRTASNVENGVGIVGYAHTSIIYLRKGTYARSLATFVLKVVPKLRKLDGWKGVIIFSCPNSGKVWVVNFFTSKKSLKRMERNGWVHLVCRKIGAAFASIPVTEAARVDGLKLPARVPIITRKLIVKHKLKQKAKQVVSAHHKQQEEK